MHQFFKNFQCSEKLIIDYKLLKLKKHLKDMQEILNSTDNDYSREHIVVFNTLLALENIRMYKLMNPK